MKFEILISESFDILTLNPSLTPLFNKNVLSFINDFEEGSWRYQKFQHFIWDNIKETALSAKERLAFALSA